MPRSRVIKPEFWNDEKLATVSRDSRLTFIGMWMCSDDYGVTKGSPAWLKSQIYPYEEDVKIAKFLEWVGELETLKVIIPFCYHSEKYYYIKHFSKHQKVDHPSKCRNPEPPKEINNDDYVYVSGTLATVSRENSDGFAMKQKQKQSLNRVKTETLLSDFEEFWTAYPNKKRKQKAKEAWVKQNGSRPPLDKILSKLLELKKSTDWTKDNGQYIPHPASWLNAGGWDDEPVTGIKSSKAPTWRDYERNQA